VSGLQIYESRMLYHSLGYTSRKCESVESLAGNVSECFQHLFWAHVRPTSGARRAQVGPWASGRLQDDAGPQAQGSGDGELPVEIPSRDVPRAQGRPHLRGRHPNGVPAEGGTPHRGPLQGLPGGARHRGGELLGDVGPGDPGCLDTSGGIVPGDEVRSGDAALAPRCEDRQDRAARASSASGYGELD
jgi:hypothetical protein